jgi:hypothetical protein
LYKYIKLNVMNKRIPTHESGIYTNKKLNMILIMNDTLISFCNQYLLFHICVQLKICLYLYYKMKTSKVIFI